MEIKGKVHCFFEQSGTFKNEFIKLGIPAEDYDIQNNFGQTDHVMDLFAEIEKGFEGGVSVFDLISCDDLIIAFFPCIRFCNVAEYNQRYLQEQWRKNGMEIHRIYELLKKQSDERYYYYQLALKMHGVVEFNGLRMIMENPWHEANYTNYFWFMRPTYIDRNRTLRGDYFIKPTAYWFTNCEPTNLHTLQPIKKSEIRLTGVRSYAKQRKDGRIYAKEDKRGICSSERSMISPDYARNFICDKILGKPQKNTQLTLFEDYGR